MNIPIKRVEYLENECPTWLRQVGWNPALPVREMLSTYGFTSSVSGECIRYRIYRDEAARVACKEMADKIDAAKMFDAGAPWQVVQAVCNDAEFLEQLEAVHLSHTLRFERKT